LTEISAKKIQLVIKQDQISRNYLMTTAPQKSFIPVMYSLAKIKTAKWLIFSFISSLIKRITGNGYH